MMQVYLMLGNCSFCTIKDPQETYHLTSRGCKTQDEIFSNLIYKCIECQRLVKAVNRDKRANSLLYCATLNGHQGVVDFDKVIGTIIF